MRHIFSVATVFLMVAWLGPGCAGQKQAAEDPEAGPPATLSGHDSEGTVESSSESAEPTDEGEVTPAKKKDRRSSGLRSYPDEETGTDEVSPEEQPSDDDSSSQYDDYSEEGNYDD